MHVSNRVVNKQRMPSSPLSAARRLPLLHFCRRLEIYSVKRTKLRVLELETSGTAEDDDTLLKMTEK